MSKDCFGYFESRPSILRLTIAAPIITLLVLGSVTMAAVYGPSMIQPSHIVPSHPDTTTSILKHNTTTSQSDHSSISTGISKSDRKANSSGPSNLSNKTTTGDFTLTTSAPYFVDKVGSTSGVYVYVESINGFNGNITLTAKLSPSTDNMPVLALSNNSGELTPDKPLNILLHVTTTDRTPSKDYTITIEGVSGNLKHSTTITATYYNPVLDNNNNGLALILELWYNQLNENSKVNVAPGGSTTLSMTVGSMQPNGYTGQLHMNATVAPDNKGINVPMPAPFFVDKAGTGYDYPVTITASSNTSIGVYRVTITLTAATGGLSKSVNFQLVVTHDMGDFVLSSQNLTVAAISNVQLHYSLTSKGFQGIVTVKVATVRNVTGLKADFDQGMGVRGDTDSASLIVDGSKTSWGTVSTTADTPPGVYDLTLTASSGIISHMIMITVTVTPKPIPVLQISTNSNHYSLKDNSTVHFDLYLKACGFNAPVTISYSPASTNWPKDMHGVMFTGYMNGVFNGVNCENVTIPIDVSAAPDAALGDYNLVIVASGGGYSSSLQLTATVTS